MSDEHGVDPTGKCCLGPNVSFEILNRVARFIHGLFNEKLEALETERMTAIEQTL